MMLSFSCEDAGRTPIDNLCRMVEAAINAGAKTINIPDTVGYTVLNYVWRIIKRYSIAYQTSGSQYLVHCHDDLGMSVANSIAAVQAGARQIEGTINGIGERAGNCSLEEIAMIIKTRQSFWVFILAWIIKRFTVPGKLVSQLCHMPIQDNKAIVGANAFSHSSGIHQDGMLKNKNTYEIT